MSTHSWAVLRRVEFVFLFPTGNMGYDGIEGPIVRYDSKQFNSTDTAGGVTRDINGSLGSKANLEIPIGHVVGFNAWHGSKLNNPQRWDKNGAPRRFKVDMAGIAFSTIVAPTFTGPRYGFHETDIVEQTGVLHLEQIQGTTTVLAHHVHNENTAGRLCYPLNWDYNCKETLWMNIKENRLYRTRKEACDGCAPQPDQKDFRGC